MTSHRGQASVCPGALPSSLSHADNHAKFKPSESSTFTENGQSYTISYGSGKLTVVLGYDTLRVSAPCALLVFLGTVSPTPAGGPDGRCLGDSLRQGLSKPGLGMAKTNIKWLLPPSAGFSLCFNSIPANFPSCLEMFSPCGVLAGL